MAERSRHPASLRSTVALAFALLVIVGCSPRLNLMGGREKCWPESDPRAASLWRGILRVDAFGGRLDTPDGEVIPLTPGALSMRLGPSGIGELVRGSDIVAKEGDDVTLFGGAGSDGALMVCDVEEVHSARNERPAGRTFSKPPQGFR